MLLTLRETAQKLNLSPGALQQRVNRRCAPPCIKIGNGKNGSLRFDENDIALWLENRKRGALVEL